MPKRTGDYDAWMIGQLTYPQLAASYINAAISEDPDMLKVALGNVAKAHRMKNVAEEAGMARESLYTSLSEAGNPTLTNLNGILKAVGLKIAVIPESGESTAHENPPAVSIKRDTDRSELKAIEGFMKAVNVSAGVTLIKGLLGAQPQFGNIEFEFNTQPGLGVKALDLSGMSICEITYQNELQQNSGILAIPQRPLGPAQTYIDQLAAPTSIGSPQLVNRR